MPPFHIEALLFDAGGTLVTLDYPLIVDLTRRHGCGVEPAALPRADARARLAVDRSLCAPRGPGGSDHARRPAYFASLLAALGIAGESLVALVQEMEEAHRRASLWRLPHPGALDTLRALRERRVRTAVVSNADGRVADVLERLGLAKHLELIVDSHFEGVEKPDPEIFRRALERLDIAAGSAAYVGDIYAIDALGARAAGLTPILLDPTDSFEDLDCAKIAALGELLTAFPAPEPDAS